MPTSLELQRQLSRFKRLPQVDDVWEGAIAPMPMWVDGEPGSDPYRPKATVWVSTVRHLVHFKMPDEQGTVDDAVALPRHVHFSRGEEESTNVNPRSAARKPSQPWRRTSNRNCAAPASRRA